jgi:hypothetical protein
MATPMESNTRFKEFTLHARRHMLAEYGFRLHGGSSFRFFVVRLGIHPIGISS